MEWLKKLIRDWFGFSRTEINGFLILLPLTVLIIFSAPAYHWWQSHRTPDFSAESKKLDSLLTLWDEKEKNDSIISSQKTQRVLFAFNPNTSTVEELQKLGFAKILSTRMASYRSKGGEFRVKSDLLKIYGMDSTFYYQVYPYIQLPDAIKETKKDVLTTTLASKKRLIFDINTADTSQLKTIYGIGTTLASRIIKFREGLGGFIKHEQFSEVYGLDSAVVNRLMNASFIDQHFMPRKLNINTADEKELSTHPYIKKSLAKAILAYRFQHGEFTDVNDLVKIPIINPEEAQRLIPYLKVKD